MISGADRRPEKNFYSQMLFSFIFRFFYCLKVRFLLNKRGMEVCIIMFFLIKKNSGRFAADFCQKKTKKCQKKNSALRADFAKKNSV